MNRVYGYTLWKINFDLNKKLICEAFAEMMSRSKKEKKEKPDERLQMLTDNMRISNPSRSTSDKIAILCNTLNVSDKREIEFSAFESFGLQADRFFGQQWPFRTHIKTFCVFKVIYGGKKHSSQHAGLVFKPVNQNQTRPQDNISSWFPP